MCKYQFLDDLESQQATRASSSHSSSCFDYNEDDEAQVLILEEDKITYINQNDYFEDTDIDLPLKNRNYEHYKSLAGNFVKQKF